MKKWLFVFSVLCLYATITLAQTGVCRVLGTKWKAKNITIKRIGGSVEDSLYEVRRYDTNDSVQLYFYTKKFVSASKSKYSRQGKYKMVKTSQGQKLNVFFKRLEFYEKGPVEKALFADFLSDFNRYPKYFLNDCSFVMVIQREGIECKIFYEKAE